MEKGVERGGGGKGGWGGGVKGEGVNASWNTFREGFPPIWPG